MDALGARRGWRGALQLLVSERGSAPANAWRTPLLGALIVALLLKAGIVLFGLSRGFELGDEGYFLLNLNHPENAPPPFEFYRLLSLFSTLRIGVLEARVLRVAVELVGSLALIAAVLRWARARVFEPDAVSTARFVLFCLMGAFLSVASRSLGYNDVTNLCVYLAVACFFLMLAAPAGAAGRRQRLLLAIGAGLQTGFQLSVKFPTAALLFGGLALAFAVFQRSLAVRERTRLIVVYALAAFAAVVAVVVLTGGLAPLLERLHVATQLPALSGYDPIALLRRWVALEIWTFLNAAVFAAAFAAALWLVRRRGSADLDRKLASALAVAAIVLFVSVVPLHPTFLHWTLVYLACLLVVLPLLLVALVWRRAALAPLLVLLAVPLIEMMGTNVPITMRLPSHILPLFVLLAVLVYDLRDRAGTVRFERRVVALLVVLTSIEFVHHQWNEPYGLPRPLSEQVAPVAGLPGIRVDVASAAFLESVASQMAGAEFERGDPIVAIDYMPGLVFFLGGVSRGSNLYMFDRPQLNCFEINRAGDTIRPYLILGGPMSAEQQACLRAFAFPNDFELIRTIHNPYEAVYATFDRPGLSHIQLWKPKQVSDTPGGDGDVQRK